MIVAKMVKSSSRVQRKVAKKFLQAAARQPTRQVAGDGDGDGCVAHDGHPPHAASSGEHHTERVPQLPVNRNAKKERSRRSRDNKTLRGGRRPAAQTTTTAAVVPVMQKGDRALQGTAGKKKTNSSSRSRGEHARVATRLVAKQQQQQDENRRMTPAEARLESAKAELELVDRVMQNPSFLVNPFLAIEEHLTGAMEFLQPQTPDVGRRK